MTVVDIPAALDRRPLIGSYTMLAAYNNCEHQAYRRYVLKDQPYVETPEMAWGNQVHTALEYRVSGGKQLPENMQQWECFASPFDGKTCKTEQKLGITKDGVATGYFDKDVWFRGKIDVTVYQGDTNDDTAFIADWKTGNSKYESELELETNAVLLHAKHPHLKKIMGSYVWLKENRLSKVYNLTDTMLTLRIIQKLMAEIEAKREMPQLYSKNQTPLCGWCSVEDCEYWKPRPGR